MGDLGRQDLFRPDEPVLSVEQDRFGHGHFVEVLKYVICNGKAPLNIALYGKWGVGKSSILEFFGEDIYKSKLREKFEFVVIDVWKLSPPMLKQEFLEALNSELGEPLAREKVEARIWHHREESATRPNIHFRSKYTWMWIAVYAALAAIPLGVGPYADAHVGSLALSSLVAGIAPIFLVIASKLGEISKSVTKSEKTIIPRIESHAQFRSLFDDIIGKIKNGKKPIIAIDNLDRCDEESVVTILSMIKAFLNDPKCVFIVACDQDAIIKHLEGKMGRFDQRHAKEFLGKFFQVSLHIPNQIKGQLHEYAQSQLDVFRSEIELDPNVADIFANAATKNPRKIQQFVYNFAIAYKMASIKEREGVIATGTVTGATPFLAKITVLREDWPDFFQRLEKRPALLEEVQKFIERSSDNGEHQDVLQANEGLKYFLKSTSTIKSIQILPFIRLNQESFETSLPELTRLIVGVNQNDVNSVKEIVQADPKKQHEYVLKICDLAEEYVANDRTMVASSALNALASIHDIVNQESKEQIINTLDRFMAGNDVLVNLVMFDLDVMFSITPSLDSDTRNRIYLKYAESISTPDEEFVILKKLIAQDQLISSPVSDFIDQNLGLLARNDKELFYAVTALLNEAPKFIKDRVFNSIIDAIQVGDDKWAKKYLELRHLAGQHIKRAFVEKMLSPIKTKEGSSVQSDHRKTYATLNETTSDDFPPRVAKYTYGALKNPARHYLDAEEKALVAGIILKAYAKLDPHDREEFATDIFAPLIQQSDTANLARFAEIVSKEKVELLEFESVVESVFSLLHNEPSREAIDLMYAGMPESKWKDLEEKIIQMHDTDFANAAVFASAFELSARAPKGLREKVLDRIAKSCKGSDCSRKLAIYQNLSKVLDSDSGLTGAFVNGLPFEFETNDGAEIDSYLRLAKDCFPKAANAKRREMFYAIFDKLQQHLQAKKGPPMLKFLISRNKDMDQSEKEQFGSLVTTILRRNVASLMDEILDVFPNLELGASREHAYELVDKLRESADETIKAKARDIMSGYSPPEA